MLDLNVRHELRPVRLPRTMEVVTWLLSVILLGAWWILRVNQAAFAGTTLILFVLMFFASFGISLSGWMDRRTVMVLDSKSIAFRNGLRDVTLSWSEIETVRVLPAQAGSKKVQVLGPRSFFEFRTLAVLSLNDKERGRSGFAEGEQILETILTAAHLVEQETDQAYTYYARK